VYSRTQFGVGKGEALSDWPGADALAGTPLLLVNPGVAVPTGPVFAGWDQVDRGGIVPGAALATLRNDMTPAAIGIAPVIGDVLAILAATPGVTLARMSGSGATCLALFSSAASRDAAAAGLEGQGWWVAASQIL
jgi:4-diphosphocytidyl-2-C-methyl-D-erythritol kinase